MCKTDKMEAAYIEKQADGAFYDTKKDREAVGVERRVAELAVGSDSPHLAYGVGVLLSIMTKAPYACFSI